MAITKTETTTGKTTIVADMLDVAALLAANQGVAMPDFGDGEAADHVYFEANNGAGSTTVADQTFAGATITIVLTDEEPA